MPRDRLDGDTGFKRAGMLASLCYVSLLSGATIPQRYYLIYWSVKVGVLQPIPVLTDAIEKTSNHSKWIDSLLNGTTNC